MPSMLEILNTVPHASDEALKPYLSMIRKIAHALSVNRTITLTPQDGDLELLIRDSEVLTHLRAKGWEIVASLNGKKIDKVEIKAWQNKLFL